RVLLAAAGDWLRRLHAAELFFDAAASDCPLAVRAGEREQDLTPQPPSLPGKGEPELFLPSPLRGGAGGGVADTTQPAFRIALLDAESLHRRRHARLADQVRDLR